MSFMLLPLYFEGRNCGHPMDTILSGPQGQCGCVGEMPPEGNLRSFSPAHSLINMPSEPLGPTDHASTPNVVFCVPTLVPVPWIDVSSSGLCFQQPSVRGLPSHQETEFDIHIVTCMGSSDTNLSRVRVYETSN
jgi:hypothetical protein